jgi:hypothetical protein
VFNLDELEPQAPLAGKSPRSGELGGAGGRSARASRVADGKRFAGLIDAYSVKHCRISLQRRDELVVDVPVDGQLGAIRVDARLRRARAVAFDFFSDALLDRIAGAARKLTSTLTTSKP